jgi:hypothetical protein
MFDNDAKVDRLIFNSAEQTAPFDLAGGSTWSREVLFIPRETWAAAGWEKLDNEIIRKCSPQSPCQGQFLLNVRFDSGITLIQPCSFAITGHVLAHLQGKERHYFGSPICGTPG